MNFENDGSSYQDMPVVLLAGGLGTRIKQETEYKPKPMIEIGEKPVLWHLMKYFTSFGFKEFIICGGFRSEKIADYLLNYRFYDQDFTIFYSHDMKKVLHGESDETDWKVTLAHTGGSEVGTGGRILNVRKYVGDRRFLCTYGDGLSDVDLFSLISAHLKFGLKGTLTAIHPKSRYGVLGLENDKVVSFQEKPQADGWINGGFFVFEPSVFDSLTTNCSLENQTLKMLAKDGQLNIYKHEGFWQSMDTYREYEMLNSIWHSGVAPWKTW